MTDRKKPGVAFWATVMLVMALSVTTLAYVGSYVLVVGECPVISSGGNTGDRLEVPVRYSADWPPVAGLFRGHRAFWTEFFAPIHAVDRVVRPSAWYVEIP